MQVSFPGHTYEVAKGNWAPTLYSSEAVRIREGKCIETDQKVAVKITRYDQRDVRKNASTEREVRVLQIVKGNLLFIQLYDHCHYQSKKNYKLIKTALFTEYCNLKDLQTVLTEGKISGREIPDIIPTFLKILSALDGFEIIHRDLKLENIFVNRTPNDLTLKLGDFGYALPRKEAKASLLADRTHGIPGTVIYMSPEVCKYNWSGDNDEDLDQVCSSSTDVWSMGVLIFRIMFGINVLPETVEDIMHTEQKKIDEIIENNKSFWFQQYMLPATKVSLQKCIKGMLMVDPKKRLSGEQLVALYSIK